MIGAVVVTYNSASSLARCLKSLWAEGVSDIVVVDNASTDASVATAKRLGVRCVAATENRGFAWGCNRGAAMLAQPHILFLNPDAYVTRGALRRVSMLFARHPAAGAVGLGLRSPTGVVETAGFGEPVTPWSLAWRKVRPQAIPTNATTVGWVSGGAMAVRRAAFDAVGGFDDGYFLYWEDVDLCKRLHDVAWDIFFEPRSVVIHERGASLDNATHKTALYDASAQRYFTKHFPRVAHFQMLSRRWYRYVRPQVS